MLKKLFLGIVVLCVSLSFNACENESTGTDPTDAYSWVIISNDDDISANPIILIEAKPSMNSSWVSKVVDMQYEDTEFVRVNYEGLYDVRITYDTSAPSTYSFNVQKGKVVWLYCTETGSTTKMEDAEPYEDYFKEAGLLSVASNQSISNNSEQIDSLNNEENDSKMVRGKVKINKIDKSIAE